MIDENVFLCNQTRSFKKRMSKRLRWLNRAPDTSNFAIHPGIRHRSRLYTSPKPFLATKCFYPEAQFKTVKNRFECHNQNLMHLNNIRNLFSKQDPILFHNPFKQGGIHETVGKN